MRFAAAPPRRRPFSALAGLLLAMAVADRANGQTEAPEARPPPSRAEELFKQGLDDMLAGRFETGCPALAESYRLDPLPGALFTLAECEAKWGRIASAYDHYQDFLSRYERMDPVRKASQTQRAGVAREQVEALAPEIPTLTIELPPDAPSRTVVKRDGDIVPPFSLGKPVRIDPGEHEVTVEAPGKAPQRYSLSIVKSEKRTLRVELEDAKQERPVAPAKPGVDPAMLRTAGFIALGVGALGAVMGTSAGVATLAQRGTIRDNCVGTTCNEEGLDAADRAQVSGAVSTAGVVIGAVGLAAGGALWLASYILEPDAASAPEPGAARARVIGGIDPRERSGSIGVVLDW